MEQKVPKLYPGTEPGIIRIGSRELACAVLEDGRRVLSQEGFLKAIGRAPKAKGGTGSSQMQVDNLPPFLTADNLKPFVTKELKESTAPIMFKMPTGQRAYGYEATLLPKVCEVYLSARDAEPPVLLSNQKHIVKACDLLMRGLAHVGIAALVDEATKFQGLRDREALQQILDKYLLAEHAKWAKRFPDDFYKQIFRLRGWEWRGMKVNRPSVVGHYTNNIVWERLAPGVIDELRRLNPPVEGKRKHKHHQYLTMDIGHPKLQEHLLGVLALMRGSTTWENFSRMLQRAFPKENSNLELDFSDNNTN